MIKKLFILGLLIGGSGIFLYKSFLKKHQEEKNPLQVVASIPPLYTIANEVMKGVGQPVLLIEKQVSPHDYALKPSDAQKIATAQVIFWIGSSLEGGLKKAFSNLPKHVHVISFLEEKELTLRTFSFSKSHLHHSSHNHHEGQIDPHIWLDPSNGEAIARIMGETLSRIDPAHRTIYQENVRQFIQKTQTITRLLQETLKDIRDVHIGVFHNAYQYFQMYFKLQPFQALTTNPEQSLTIPQLTRLEHKVKKHRIFCPHMKRM